MADDPNLQPGNSIRIATDGIAGADPISIATRGFIRPIIGDLMLGGSAIVIFGGASTDYIYTASGGLVVDGTGAVRVTRCIDSSGSVNGTLVQ